MSFTVPTFNLHVNIWRQANNPTTSAPDVQVMGNLAFGRRVNIAQLEGGQPGYMSLLLPATTDIRMNLNASLADWVEVPAGSARYYQVVDVDDVGKGFANEFRVATLTKTTFVGALHWPQPIP